MFGRSRAHRLALVLVALALGCSRCGTHAPANAGLLALVPVDAQAVIVAPDLGRVADDLLRLQGLGVASFIAQLQGFPTATDFGNAIVAQVGVELRSRKALEAAGVALDKGAGWVRTAQGGEYLVIGARDVATLEARLTALAKSRLGASQVRSATEAGVQVTTFSLPGGPTLFALAASGDFVILGAGAEAGHLAQVATLSKDHQLANDQRFNSALGLLPSSPELFGYVPSDAIVAGYTLPGRSAFSASLEKTALALHLAVPLPSLSPLAAALKKVASKDLTRQLPPDAVFAASFNADPKTWAAIWPRVVPPGLTRAIEASGVDVDRDLLANLAPGGLVSLALAPTAQLGQGLPSLDVRRTNPFRFVQLVAALPVKDAAQADRTLGALATGAPHVGLTMQKATVAGTSALLSHYAQGEGADVARVGDEVLVAAPVNRLAQAIAQAKSPSGSGFNDAALNEVLTRPAIGAVLDLHRLADEVRALPSSAWGVGGFAMKAAAVRWLEATDELTGVTLELHSKGGVGLFDLSLRLGARAP